MNYEEWKKHWIWLKKCFTKKDRLIDVKSCLALIVKIGTSKQRQRQT